MPRKQSELTEQCMEFGKHTVETLAENGGTGDPCAELRTAFAEACALVDTKMAELNAAMETKITIGGLLEECEQAPPE